MKVLALVIITVASVYGKGSGPYLPSGWRPDGPAFYLPSEIAKPSPAPVIDLSLQGSEASGSDFLQEYGPPKVQDVSQNLINQGLPDVAIEQDFGFVLQSAGVGSEAASEAPSEVPAEKVEEVSEVKPDAITTEESTTEAQSSVNDSPLISAELPILDFEVQGTTIGTVEQTTELASGQSNQQESLENQQESSTVLSELDSAVASTENAVPASVEPSVENVPELQNIPDIIASLEQEILTQEAEINHAVSEIGSIQGASGSLEQLPEGFLEYGPPGFTEYGPPKGDEGKSENIQAIESNETRRRRFSPKFRHSKKH